ncbi:MAG: CsbD family protein [Terracidiphilus sp.]
MPTKLSYIKTSPEGKMDKDRVKGAIDDSVGRAKRQVGEWTGDTKTQAEGAAQQVKGKAEKAWGNVKDAARDLKNDVHETKAEHDAKKDAHRRSNA